MGFYMSALGGKTYKRRLVQGGTQDISIYDALVNGIWAHDNHKESNANRKKAAPSHTHTHTHTVGPPLTSSPT